MFLELSESPFCDVWNPLALVCIAVEREALRITCKVIVNYSFGRQDIKVFSVDGEADDFVLSLSLVRKYGRLLISSVSEYWGIVTVLRNERPKQSMSDVLRVKWK